jgi:hypothetical protein
MSEIGICIDATDKGCIFRVTQCTKIYMHTHQKYPK